MADSYDINLKDSDSLESSYTSLNSESTEILNDFKKNLEYVKSCLSDDVWLGKTKNALSGKLDDLSKANETVETKLKDYNDFLSTTIVAYKDTDVANKNESDNLSNGY